ncbi:MAG: hypothetical protein QME51_10600, partial [Planctomycetota bacterium]|nr:hypothetical protein [Planctomycetota bacterium]
IGQQVASEDFYGTLKDIPMSKRIEMPVAEDMQTGIALGFALQDFLPISIYQRMDFLPRAADQIINHLNLFSKMSRGRFNPKVIIRTTVGTTEPLNVGPQHSKDLSGIFKKAVQFPVFSLYTLTDIDMAYGYAMRGNTSCMIIEYQELYGQKK